MSTATKSLTSPLFFQGRHGGSAETVDILEEENIENEDVAVSGFDRIEDEKVFEEEKEEKLSEEKVSKVTKVVKIEHPFFWIVRNR